MGNCSALQFPSNFGVHTKRVFPGRPEPSLFLTGCQLSPGHTSLFFFPLSWMVTSPTPIHVQTGLSRENAEISGKSWQALPQPTELHTPHPPTPQPQSHHTQHTQFAQGPACAAETQLASPVAFNRTLRTTCNQGRQN